MKENILLRHILIGKTQIKLSLAPSFFLSLAILTLIYFGVGISHLDTAGASYLLERYVALIGVVCFVPIWLPEQDLTIAEVVDSKVTTSLFVGGIRFFYHGLLCLLCITIFIVLMKIEGGTFQAGSLIFPTFSTAFFLGTFGFLIYSMTRNVIAGYLVSMTYYVMNYFLSVEDSRSLGSFYLFSLPKEPVHEKYGLFLLGIMLFAIGMFSRRYMQNK